MNTLAFKELDKNISFLSPLDIPEQKKSKFKIEREVLKSGSEITVVSLRNTFMMGVRPTKFILDGDRIVHKLVERKTGGTLMSDCPQEIFLHNTGIQNARGNVLIGGLGLGYIASMLARKKEVESITVVEIEKEIIEMVEPYIIKNFNPRRINIVKADLFDYLKSGKAKFDYAYFDIWYGTNESTWLDYVVPLRILIWKKYGNKFVDCWGEQEMESQIVQSIYTTWMMCKNNLENILNCNWKPREVIANKLIELKKRMTITKKTLDNMAYNMTYNVGSPAWLSYWNWNKY